MAETRPTPTPTLQKPPGYRDPTKPPAPRPPPPRRPQLPPALRYPVKPALRRGRRRSYCRRICCWICAVFIASAFLLAVAGALAYLWFQPRLPAFRLVAVQAPQFRISAGPDGTMLDAAIAVRIQAANPNGKIGLWYGGSEARVTVADVDGDVDLGSGSAPGFVQERRNSTVVRFTASVKGVLVDDAVGSRLKARMKSKEIQFSVEVRTTVGVRVGGKSTGRLPIRVLCGPVSLKQVAVGASPAKCRIYMFRWINLQ